MPKTGRKRIDYQPGGAALEALAIAAAMFPNTRPQSLLDKLVITGLSALAHKHWQAPYLWGHRDRWRLPDDLRPGEPA